MTEVAIVERDSNEKTSKKVLRKIRSLAAVNEGSNNRDDSEPDTRVFHMITGSAIHHKPTRPCSRSAIRHACCAILSLHISVSIAADLPTFTGMENTSIKF